MNKKQLIYCALREKIIINDFCHLLNSKQKEAVLNTEIPMLILAGAGSGKTTVLVRKIINILNFGKINNNQIYDKNISDNDIKIIEKYYLNKSLNLKEQVYNLLKIDIPHQNQILVITFTNKAANELKERLNIIFNTSFIWVHTFHSACLRILRKFFHKISDDTKFKIYDNNDKIKVITNILKFNKIENVNIKKILDKINKAKDEFISPLNFIEHYGFSEINKIIAAVYLEYETYLKKINALDFDDIILYTVRLLENNLDVKTYYQNKFKYIFVDEYQDTNCAQYRFINCIVNQKKNNICVVGDDDQSIYKFRGANINNILNFEKTYKNSIIIRLEQNYRSTKIILDAANNVIKKNTIRKNKVLWTNNESGDIIYVYQASDQYDEANYISKDIKNKKINFNECAILYRNHHLATNIEASLRSYSIPYKIVKGISFFQRSEIIDLMAYLHVINDINDFLRIKRIINKPTRKIGKTTIDILEKILNENNNIHFSYILDNINDFSNYLSKRSINSIIKFKELINYFKEFLIENSLDKLIDNIIKQTNYIEKVCKSNESAIKNINEFKIFIKDYVNKSNNSLKDFLQEISLVTDVKDNNNNVVTLMTIHAAKGLEYKHVYICGFEDGIFPNLRSSFSLEEEEEERRLCYVAMTRAKKHLTITWAKKRVLHGKVLLNKPSKFLNDIPYNLKNVNGTLPINQFSLKKQDYYNTKTLELNINNKIMHKTFGHGIIKNIIKIKDDYLLIVLFENNLIKKLILSYANKYINKC